MRDCDALSEVPHKPATALVKAALHVINHSDPFREFGTSTVAPMYRLLAEIYFRLHTTPCELRTALRAKLFGSGSNIITKLLSTAASISSCSNPRVPSDWLAADTDKILEMLTRVLNDGFGQGVSAEAAEPTARSDSPPKQVAMQSAFRLSLNSQEAAGLCKAFTQRIGIETIVPFESAAGARPGGLRRQGSGLRTQQFRKLPTLGYNGDVQSVVDDPHSIKELQFTDGTRFQRSRVEQPLIRRFDRREIVCALIPHITGESAAWEWWRACLQEADMVADAEQEAAILDLMMRTTMQRPQQPGDDIDMARRYALCATAHALAMPQLIPEEQIAGMLLQVMQSDAIKHPSSDSDADGASLTSLVNAVLLALAPQLTERLLRCGHVIGTSGGSAENKDWQTARDLDQFLLETPAHDPLQSGRLGLLYELVQGMRNMAVVPNAPLLRGVNAKWLVNVVQNCCAWTVAGDEVNRPSAARKGKAVLAHTAFISDAFQALSLESLAPEDVALAARADKDRMTALLKRGCSDVARELTSTLQSQGDVLRKFEDACRAIQDAAGEELLPVLAGSGGGGGAGGSDEGAQVDSAYDPSRLAALQTLMSADDENVSNSPLFCTMAAQASARPALIAAMKGEYIASKSIGLAALEALNAIGAW